MATTKIPASVSDVLLHTQDGDYNESVVLPITRYKNVMNAPKVVQGPTEIVGAPFALYAQETETLTLEEIRETCGGII